MTKNNRKLIRIFFNMQTIWVLVCSHSPRMAHYKPHVPQYVLMSRHNAGGKDLFGGYRRNGFIQQSRAVQLFYSIHYCWAKVVVDSGGIFTISYCVACAFMSSRSVSKAPIHSDNNIQQYCWYKFIRTCYCSLSQNLSFITSSLKLLLLLKKTTDFITITLKVESGIIGFIY